jgi:hypothetical protein
MDSAAAMFGLCGQSGTPAVRRSPDCSLASGSPDHDVLRAYRGCKDCQREARDVTRVFVAVSRYGPFHSQSASGDMTHFGMPVVA